MEAIPALALTSDRIKGLGTDYSGQKGQFGEGEGGQVGGGGEGGEGEGV